MKQWEAKFLGFSAPWWLLLQMAIPDYAQSWRVGIGWLLLIGGFGLALVWRDPIRDLPSQSLADSFLRGILSIVALPLLAVAVLVMMAIVGGVFQLLGLL